MVLMELLLHWFYSQLLVLLLLSSASVVFAVVLVMPFIFTCLCGTVGAVVEADLTVVVIRFCCNCCDALNLVPVCVRGCFGAVVEVGVRCVSGRPHGCG